MECRAVQRWPRRMRLRVPEANRGTAQSVRDSESDRPPWGESRHGDHPSARPGNPVPHVLPNVSSADSRVPPKNRGEIQRADLSLHCRPNRSVMSIVGTVQGVVPPVSQIRAIVRSSSRHAGCHEPAPKHRSDRGELSRTFRKHTSRRANIGREGITNHIIRGTRGGPACFCIDWGHG